MLTQDQFTRLSRALPILQRADPQLLREFQTAAFFTRIPAGKDVFVEGDDPDAIALLISGVVRVYKIGETGREITLYRFGLGESCSLPSSPSARCTRPSNSAPTRVNSTSNQGADDKSSAPFLKGAFHFLICYTLTLIV